LFRFLICLSKQEYDKFKTAKMIIEVGTPYPKANPSRNNKKHTKITAQITNIFKLPSTRDVS
ncbi:hypothetical protein, partial [Vibrio anguillarum]|uniref:hypothetical protein n=1 Tax=Vibrio anguillarum TaxID=55601 RepID=UPI001BE43C58